MLPERQPGWPQSLAATLVLSSIVLHSTRSHQHGGHAKPYQPASNPL